MTKKDFQLLAEVVKEEVEYWQRWGPEELPPPANVVLFKVAHKLGARLKRANPHFNELKFMQGAGLG